MITLGKHTFDIYPFLSYDGFGCNLWRLRSNFSISKGPVLLVHGAGVRSNIFNPPNDINLISVLAEAGYDVWLENWRGSIECNRNEWDLDTVAENDHPVAVREVCRHTGAETIKAIIHCQGSTSFMMSLAKGLVPQVSTVISNAVSLHPVVPGLSKFKLDFVVPLVKPLVSYLNPAWGNNANGVIENSFRFLVNLTHHENDTSVGKFVSFTYGAGRPALWELNNLTEKTKNWIQDEFGNVPISFFEHIQKCVKAGVLVSKDGTFNYGIAKPKTDARFAFFTGKLNKCFKSQSQKTTFDFFDTIRPSFHSLHEYAAYSHLDIFFGKDADKDIFPTMIKELNN